jgi:hypothetical protein
MPCDCSDPCEPCNCSCLGATTPIVVVQCKSCASCNGECNISERNKMTQKRIWKQVRVPSSLFTMSLSSATVVGDIDNTPPVDYGYVNWNQSSDRNKPSVQKLIVPSHGNSLYRTLTRHRPGAGSPGGIGVDIKHNSYDRYLLKKKGEIVRNHSSNNIKPNIGNKTISYGVLSNNCVKC